MNESTAQVVFSRLLAALLSVWLCVGASCAQQDDKTLRVFLFAGQSNMFGADSKMKDIARFPPFAGFDEPQKGVRKLLADRYSRAQ